jgi:uncharacterized membrane protein
MIKNIYLASATAALYYGWVLDSITPTKKIIATLAVFIAMYLIMRDADKHAMKEDTMEYLKRREKANARKTS